MDNEDAHYRRMLPQNVKYNFNLVNRKLLQVTVHVQRFGNYPTLTLLKILFYQKSLVNKAINKF